MSRAIMLFYLRLTDRNVWVCVCRNSWKRLNANATEPICAVFVICNPSCLYAATTPIGFSPTNLLTIAFCLIRCILYGLNGKRRLGRLIIHSQQQYIAHVSIYYGKLNGLKLDEMYSNILFSMNFKSNEIF